MSYFKIQTISLLLATLLLEVGCADKVSEKTTATSPDVQASNIEAVSAAPSSQVTHPRLLVTRENLETASAVWKSDPARFKALANTRGFESGRARRLEENMNGWNDGRILMLCGVLYAVTQESAYEQALHRWIQDGIKPGFVTEPQPIVIEGIGIKNQDLNAGQFLITSSILYDLLVADSLYQEKYPEDIQVLKQALLAQATRTYEDLSRLKRVPYEQNHFYIAAAGLGLAALALEDGQAEYPEIQAWNDYAMEALDRSHQIIGSDGFYYEGVSYWSMFFPYVTIYAEALRRNQGIDWLTTKEDGESGLLTGLDDYLAHVSLPEPGKFYAYADYGPRIPWEGYDKPVGEITEQLAFYPLLQMQEYEPSPLAQKVIQREWAHRQQVAPRFVHYVDNALTLLWLPVFEESLKGKPEMSDIRSYTYFADHEVIAWRESWDEDADDLGTVLYFRCGPPEGHAAAAYREAYPEWKMGMGHVHPDAGDFFVFSRGKYLASAGGYSWAKRTAEHSCLLVDGKGQFKEGTAWNTFNERDYDRYDELSLDKVWLASSVASAAADIAAAYFPVLDHYERQLILVDGRWLVVRDDVSADEPHTYSWVLNSEKPFSSMVGVAKAWTTTNGGAALTVYSLNDDMQAEMGPTLVNVSSTDKPELAERAQHLSLTTPKLTEAVITNVIVIGTADDRATAKVMDDGGSAVRIHQGNRDCTVFLKSEPRFDGVRAYYWSEAGALQSIGLYGSRIDIQGDYSIKLSVPGQAVLNLTDGVWLVEAEMPEAGTLIVKVSDEVVATLDLPKGQSVQPLNGSIIARN